MNTLITKISALKFNPFILYHFSKFGLVKKNVLYCDIFPMNLH